MSRKILQFKEFPRIRFDGYKRVSFNCSDDTFLRLARSVYTKKIEIELKNEEVRIYDHFAGNRYCRRFGQNRCSLSRLESEEILKLIKDNRPDYCFLRWMSGGVKFNIHISVHSPGNQLRVNVPREVLPAHYRDELLILSDFQDDDELWMKFLTDTNAIKALRINPLTNTTERHVFTSIDECGSIWRWDIYGQEDMANSGELTSKRLIGILQRILAGEDAEMYVDQKPKHPFDRQLYLSDPDLER